MFDKIGIFDMSAALAKYAGTRQALISQNVANVNTPGYQAQDLKPFSDLYRDVTVSPNMRTTRQGHIQSSHNAGLEGGINLSRDTALNGNSVSVEEQMLNAVEVSRQHNRAITVYKSALDILRTSINTRA